MSARRSEVPVTVSPGSVVDGLSVVASASDTSAKTNTSATSYSNSSVGNETGAGRFFHASDTEVGCALNALLGQGAEARWSL